MLTLDKAIRHAEEKACGNTECAEEYGQLAEWLKELSDLREQIKEENLPSYFEPNKEFKARRIDLRGAFVFSSEESELINALISFMKKCDSYKFEDVWKKDDGGYYEEHHHADGFELIYDALPF